MKKSEIKTYIVKVCCLEKECFNVFKVIGTELMVKKYLAKKVRDAVAADEAHFSKGSTFSRDITVDKDGVINGYAKFSYYHITYTASPEMEPINLCDSFILKNISEDFVRVTCYGKTKEMLRPQAITFYGNAVEATRMNNSSECGRYKTILCGLYEGKKEVSDED